MASRPWWVLQHVPFEGPGLIADVVRAAGLELSVRHVYDGDAVPEADEVGGLVVMGGPMSVAADAEFPFLRAERELLAAVVPVGVPVLGVCLGAQLMVAGCGGQVSTGAAGEEIGLGTVELTADGRADPVLGPAGRVLPVLHWHGDTYTLPPDAVSLASSDRYPQQAFRIGTRAYGLQFHVEVDATAAESMEPHLPADVHLDRRHLALVQRSGGRVLQRFVDVATS